MNEKSVKDVNRNLKKISKRLRKVKIGKSKKRRGVKSKPNNSGMDDFRESGLGKYNAVRLRKGDKSEALRHVQVFRKYLKNQYLMGLIHPDEAVQKGIPLKLPSDIPIPTAAIGFHEQYQLSTSSLGTFLLSWRPNYFTCVPALNGISCNDLSKITFNNSSSLTGTSATIGNNFISGSYIPNVDIQRYRLVSALIKIQYNGPVLNQSGTMLSCITFDSTRIVIGNSSNSVTSFAEPLMDRFCNFSLIANGLWNQTVDVTTNGHGLEAIYVPMDPIDVAFDRISGYYGTIPTAAGPISPAPESAPQTYVFAGRNMPPSTSCILVDVYYNFEVIADPTVAPILRASTSDVPSKKEGRDVGDALSSFFQKKGFISSIVSRNSDSVWGSMINLGLKYLPKLLSAM
jgi:replicative DNA helicase